MSQSRRRLKGPEKLAIVKRCLVERVPISDLCDGHELQPSWSHRCPVIFFGVTTPNRPGVLSSIGCSR